MQELKYLNHYHEETKRQVIELIKVNGIEAYLLKKYPTSHNITSDKQLFSYISKIKEQYIKKAPPLSKTLYDSKINVIHNALGTHHFISRVQGSKLKAKNEIRIATMFKNVPEAFLEMIVVHELAHFKEKEHNKAFYKLCTYMKEDYHQAEFDLRLYLTHIDLHGSINFKTLYKDS